MVFKANFNNISVISWLSVLLVEETGVLEENHRPVASHRHTVSHNIVSSTHHLSDIRTHNFSGDRHWLQLPYDHGHEGSGIIIKKNVLLKKFKALTVIFHFMNSDKYRLYSSEEIFEQNEEYCYLWREL
jgi:hypothetical protein